MKKASHLISMSIIILIALSSLAILYNNYKENIDMFASDTSIKHKEVLDTLFPSTKAKELCIHDITAIHDYQLKYNEKCNDGSFNMPPATFTYLSGEVINNSDTIVKYPDKTFETCIVTCSDCGNNGLLNLSNCSLANSLIYTIKYKVTYEGNEATCKFTC